MKQFSKGSEWRRWDLHIHTPGTKLANSYNAATVDEAWERFIIALQTSPVEAFGITDYFSSDSFFEFLKRFRAKYPDTEKAFFLNIEFRLAESISADGSLPDIHVIFDNDSSISNPEKIGRFLTNLSTQSTDNDDVKTRCSDLKTTAEFMAASVSLDDLLKALKETFGTSKPYLIVFPANNNGLRSTDSNSPRKVALADRIDKESDIFFGNQSNRDFLLKVNRYQEGESEPKPVISGSDAHSFADLERLGGDVAGYPPTWIKADLTFSGLRQICFEPADRAFIGAEPEVIVRQRQAATKFIQQLNIDQVAGYNERNGRWFKSVKLPLNPELTAVIGNKGSGKSAVVDIIGLLGESRQEGHFSFLADDSKSKKFRQRGFAENFSAELTWLTGKQEAKKLSDACDITKPETVRYLPQHYFEQLTNEIEIEQFRREIEEVVFSHVDETDKLGKATFSELEEAKTLQSKEQVSVLKKRLREVNLEIADLERQSATSYRKELIAKIAAKKDELTAIDAAKPTEIPKPSEANDEQKRLADEVDRLTAIQNSLTESGQQKLNEISNLKSQLQEVASLREALLGIETSAKESIAGLSERCTALGFDISKIFQVNVSLAPLDVKIAELKSAIATLEASGTHDFSPTFEFAKLISISDIRAAYEFIRQEIDKIKEQLSTPQRRYQAYVEKLTQWQKRRLDIIGSDSEPKPETLSWFEQKLAYIDNTLANLLEDKRTARRSIVGRVFESKSVVLQFYSDLKSSVEERLQVVRTEGFQIEIDASFVIDSDFRRQFLNHIDQRKRGPYRNDQDAQQILLKDISETDWNSFDSVYGFCEKTLGRMNDVGLDFVEQVHDVKELYDFLCSLDYLSAKYELRLGGKNLNELSPGEKGLLLLVFYLQLDKNDTPLVIDQPEDNLDNDSIFKVLANCIREAKKTRQVILVTHNPNLAVGADAEQIIYVKLDKADQYKFSYESGSIENPALNRRIVDVLEGSQPAFVKRRLKYGIK